MLPVGMIVTQRSARRPTGWLWYAEKFHGEIITNFDQQSPIFQDAPFSLQNLWAGRIRKETLDRFGFEESEELVGAVMRIIKRSTGPTYQISGGTVAIGPGAQAITNTAVKDQAMTTASWGVWNCPSPTFAKQESLFSVHYCNH